MIHRNTLARLSGIDRAAVLDSMRRGAEDALDRSGDAKGKKAARRLLKRIEKLWNEFFGEEAQQ
jgi:hypothetical protein